MGFSPVRVKTCQFRWNFSAKDFPQVSHLKGFSPVWIKTWIDRWNCFAEYLPQISHLKSVFCGMSQDMDCFHSSMCLWWHFRLLECAKPFYTSLTFECLLPSVNLFMCKFRTKWKCYNIDNSIFIVNCLNEYWQYWLAEKIDLWFGQCWAG